MNSVFFSQKWLLRSYEKCFLSVWEDDLQKPNLTIFPDKINVTTGEGFMLNCSVNIFVSLMYQFVHNDTIIQTSSSPTLNVKKILTHHSGKYFCHVFHENKPCLQNYSSALVVIHGIYVLLFCLFLFCLFLFYFAFST